MNGQVPNCPNLRLVFGSFRLQTSNCTSAADRSLHAVIVVFKELQHGGDFYPKFSQASVGNEIVSSDSAAVC